MKIYTIPENYTIMHTGALFPIGCDIAKTTIDGKVLIFTFGLNIEKEALDQFKFDYVKRQQSNNYEIMITPEILENLIINAKKLLDNPNTVAWI
jgi:hypothetical protein